MEAGGFRRASVAALVAITVTVGCAVTPAGAASLDAAGTHVVAFSDTHRTPVASLVPLELTTLQRLYCAGKGDRAASCHSPRRCGWRGVSWARTRTGVD